MIQYCFLTTTSENLNDLLYTLNFFLLDVKCNSCRIYINMCSFHWILLDIQVDKGIVEVRDPMSRGLDGFRDLQKLLQT